MNLIHVDYWDVGQGDCSVIQFSDQNIILIDTGGKRSPVVDWLADRPQSIYAVILTHNDADHAGALCSIVAEHRSRIGAIYLLDFPARNDQKFLRLFRCARAQNQAGAFSIERAEAGKVVWESSDGQTSLEILHPNFIQQVEASSGNEASALVALIHKTAILSAWPGDLSLKTAATAMSARTPAVLVGPHHGSPSETKKELQDIRLPFVPRNTFISVGTSNTYDHPRRQYLVALARQGCEVTCSELTGKCDPGRVSEKKAVFPGSAMLGLRPNHLGVPCRGSFRMLFQDGRLLPDDNHPTHLERIGSLNRPLCNVGNRTQT